MSVLQQRLVEKLKRDIPLINGRDPGWEFASFFPATGHWRTSPYADVYRWEVNTPGYSLGCWDTMTEAVKSCNKLVLSDFRGCKEIDVVRKEACQ